MTATLETSGEDALRSIQRKVVDDFAEIEVHPAASLFPMMGEQEFAELKADIEKHGQHDMIVYWRGQLLDGRNRLRACRELKIRPCECELEDNDDPVAYVLSANLHRRHLTTAQRACVAVEVKKLLEPEAKERKAAGQQSGGKTSGRGRKKQSDSSGANLPPSNGRKTRDQAGELLKVSGRTVDKAEKILNSGSPELIAEVKAGKVSIDKAHKSVAKTPCNKPRKHRTTLKALREERIQQWEILQELTGEFDCLGVPISKFYRAAETILKDKSATSEQLAKVVQGAQLRMALLADLWNKLESMEAGS